MPGICDTSSIKTSRFTAHVALLHWFNTEWSVNVTQRVQHPTKKSKMYKKADGTPASEMVYTEYDTPRMSEGQAREWFARYTAGMNVAFQRHFEIDCKNALRPPNTPA